MLDVSRQRVMQLVAAGQLTANGKFGVYNLIDRASVVELIRKRAQQAKAKKKAQKKAAKNGKQS